MNPYPTDISSISSERDQPRLRGLGNLVVALKQLVVVALKQLVRLVAVEALRRHVASVSRPAAAVLGRPAVARRPSSHALQQRQHAEGDVSRTLARRTRTTATLR